MSLTTPTLIAIDGTASSGKSSLAAGIALHYGFAHLNTGLLYRAVAHECLELNIGPDDEPAVVAIAEGLGSKPLAELQSLLNNPELRSEIISSLAPKTSKIQLVRQALLNLQLNFPIGKSGAVVEGRDITTFIFPQAPVQLYITCSLEEAANRRTKQLLSGGFSATYATVLADIRAREQRDLQLSAYANRISPTAYVLDNTHLTVAGTLAAALAFCQQRLGF